jgi:hypothetical protein
LVAPWKPIWAFHGHFIFLFGHSLVYSQKLHGVTPSFVLVLKVYESAKYANTGNPALQSYSSNKGDLVENPPKNKKTW